MAAALALDPRVARAAAKALGSGAWEPTAVQAMAIRLMMEGKDVVARAPTGTGKTLAYLLPMMHVLLTQGTPGTGMQGLALCPTKELVAQTLGVAQRLVKACGGGWSATATAASANDAPDAPPPPVSRLGELVVATPGRIATVCASRQDYANALNKLMFLALDEADLLLSYGHFESIKAIARSLRQGTQRVLVSATAPGAGAKELHALLYRGAEHIDVTAATPTSNGADDEQHGTLAKVQHRYLACATRAERLAVLASLLKHNMLTRKVLIFAKNVDECVRLRLSLECFGMSKVALLNATMPLQDRMSCIEQFNRGLFDVLLACDGGTAKGPSSSTGADADAEVGEEEEEEGEEEEGGAGAGAARFDAEYGISRGVDFRDVNTVVHYDMPHDATTYVHRAGRCGRLGNASADAGSRGKPTLGMSLSLLNERELDNEWRTAIIGACGGKTPAAGTAGAGAATTATTADERALREHEDAGRIRKLAAALQYRAEDVARLITKQRVYDFRKRELRLAFLRAETLSESNGAGARLKERDRDLLRRTGPLGGNHTTVAPELAHFPDYLRGKEVRARAPRASAKRRDGGAKRDRAGEAADRIGVAGKLEAKQWGRKRRKRSKRDS